MRGECLALVGPDRFSLGNKQQNSGMLFQVLQATHLNAYKLWSSECVCIYMCEVCVPPAQQGGEGICMNIVEIIALLRQRDVQSQAETKGDPRGLLAPPSTSSPLAQPFLTLQSALLPLGLCEIPLLGYTLLFCSCSFE